MAKQEQDIPMPRVSDVDPQEWARIAAALGAEDEEDARRRYLLKWVADAHGRPGWDRKNIDLEVQEVTGGQFASASKLYEAIEGRRPTEGLLGSNMPLPKLKREIAKVAPYLPAWAD